MHRPHLGQQVRLLQHRGAGGVARPRRCRRARRRRRRRPRRSRPARAGRRGCARSGRSCLRTRGRAGRPARSRCARRPRASGPNAEWWNVRVRVQCSAADSVIAALLSQGDDLQPRCGALERPAGGRPRGRAPRARGQRGTERVAARRRARRAAPDRRGGPGPDRRASACTRHQREALFAAWAGPDDRHHRHRLGQVAVLQPAHARRALPRRQGARAVPVPDQGAGPGSGAGAVGVRPGQAGATGDLRRRHAARGPRADPAARQRRAHEPRHAPRRHPAPPRRLGGPVRQPRGRGHRRGAHLPRGVRLACRERHPSPAPHRRRLRHGSALPAGLGDDRQPGGAGGGPHRAGGNRARAARRLAHPASADRRVEPAAGRRRARHPRVGARRGGERGRATSCATRRARSAS